MKKYIPFVLVSLLVLSLASCLKKQDFPDEPQLEYIGFTQFDSVGLADPIGFVSLDFTDGDGNVGLNTEDDSGPFHVDSAYYYNLFIYAFRDVDGEFVEVPVSKPNHVRIEPRLSDSDNPIEGDIDAGVFIPIRTNTDTAREVTIRWEIYLVDRSFNRSNLITTPEFVFQR